MIAINNHLAGHIRPPHHLALARSPSPVPVKLRPASVQTGSSMKASALPVNDDEISDLSSLPSSPNPSRAPSLAIAAMPRHNRHTASSTDLAGREPESKTRIERPANASRAQFSKIVDWDDYLIKSTKVQ